MVGPRPLVICVTDRRQCVDDFDSRIRAIARARPFAILLREKDLSLGDYFVLAERCAAICKEEGARLVVHTHADIAARLGLSSLHQGWRAFQDRGADGFSFRSVSIHSKDEAELAQKLGATHLIAGHVFATASKPGLPPRGLSFLAEICAAVSIPVFAIGGATPENIADIKAAGAAGACALSPFMTAPDPESLARAYQGG